MKKNVAIACTPGDVHVFAVAEALRLKGGNPLLWFTPDFPARARETFLFEDGSMTFKVEGPEMAMAAPQVDTVWSRRISFSQSYDVLHSADWGFAEVERRRFREGALLIAFPDAFWVNPAEASLRTENKLFQQAAASALGFLMPPTLFTNDPGQIRSFMRRHGGQIVYKPITGTGWSDGERSWACHTVALTADQLVEDPLLEAVPGIYQALIPKAHEIRLTMIGARPFAAKVLSQETEEGKVDWRRAYHELRMEACEVPSGLVQSCLSLMGRLGLVFGCFDFIVTPEGEYVFLEVNQMGQFLFVEQFTGLPLLDAFCELLLQARIDFRWNDAAPAVRFEDLSRSASELAAKSLELHEDAHAIPRNECPPVPA